MKNKKVINDLEQAYQELEQVVLQRTAALEEAYQKLQEQHTMMVHAEKMASVGYITAGISHEINNPLAFVKSNLHTLVDYVKSLEELDIQIEKWRNGESSPEELQSWIESENLNTLLKDLGQLTQESLQGVQRIQDIVISLKNFSRADSEGFSPSDINAGIEDTLKIVWNELKDKCTLRKNLQKIPLVNCALGQLNQVFLNLIINAIQASSEQGEIYIETSYQDEKVCIKIADEGVGIPKSKIGKVFSPLYTSKPKGIGTGMGLAISKKIIEKHQGSIEVQSQEGEGCVFTITLPLSPAK